MEKQKLEIPFIAKITRTINKLYCTTFYLNIESNPGPNIVSGKPNLKNGSLKNAHINACSLLPKIDLIELEMSNNDIILVSETHLSQDIDNEDIQLRGFQIPIRVDRNRTVAEWQFSPNLIYIYVKSRNFTLVKLKSFG